MEGNKTMSLLSSIVYNLTIRPRLIKLKKLLPEAKIHPAGSRYVCDPPVMATDVDFLVFSADSVDCKLLSAGYVETPFADYRGLVLSGDFSAYRRGVVNLIVTSSVKYAEGFHTATHICKSRNVRDKWYRVLIHEAVRGKMTTIDIEDIGADLKMLLANFNGPYGHAIHKAYRAQYELGGFP
jgi:hypothetical protein